MAVTDVVDSLLPRTRAVYRAIIKYKLENNGNSPSYEQLMEIVGITSKSVLKYHVDKLNDLRLITKNQVRGIEVPGIIVRYNPNHLDINEESDDE